MPRQVDRAEFQGLLDQALVAAAGLAERHFDRSIPERRAVDMLGLGDRRLTPAAAADALYVGPDRFYKVIDVGIRWIEGDTTVAVVIPSGFEPCPWEETIDPAGLGPFKVILPMDLREPIWHRIIRALPKL